MELTLNMGSLILRVEGDVPALSLEWWTFAGISTFLVVFGGIMSGLTLGLMSLTPVDLQVLMRSGTDKEKRQAAQIFPVVQRQHQLLVTLLLCNAVAMEALPIFLDRLCHPVVAILLSVTFVLLFGEIIPQAICSRYGLAVGASMVLLVRLLLILCWPIAYPISKLLDSVLGHEDHLMERDELKALVSIHSAEEGHGGQLTHDEATIISGALDLVQKTAEEAMTPIESTFSLPISAKLDMETMNLIIAKGHSRVPIYKEEPKKLVGTLLVKSLVTARPEDETPVSAVALRRIPKFPAEMPLYSVLNNFQEGSSHIAAVVRKRKRKIVLSPSGTPGASPPSGTPGASPPFGTPGASPPSSTLEEGAPLLEVENGTAAVEEGGGRSSTDSLAGELSFRPQRRQQTEASPQESTAEQWQHDDVAVLPQAGGPWEGVGESLAQAQPREDMDYETRGGIRYESKGEMGYGFKGERGYGSRGGMGYGRLVEEAVEAFSFGSDGKEGPNEVFGMDSEEFSFLPPTLVPTTDIATLVGAPDRADVVGITDRADKNADKGSPGGAGSASSKLQKTVSETVGTSAAGIPVVYSTQAAAAAAAAAGVPIEQGSLIGPGVPVKVKGSTIKGSTMSLADLERGVNFSSKERKTRRARERQLGAIGRGTERGGATAGGAAAASSSYVAEGQPFGDGNRSTLRRQASLGGEDGMVTEVGRRRSMEIEPTEYPATGLEGNNREASLAHVVWIWEGGQWVHEVEEEEVIGIITMEDVIEELLQEEIVDETDEYVDVHRKVKVARKVGLNMLPRRGASKLQLTWIKPALAAVPAAFRGGEETDVNNGAAEANFSTKILANSGSLVAIKRSLTQPLMSNT